MAGLWPDMVYERRIPMCVVGRRCLGVPWVKDARLLRSDAFSVRARWPQRKENIYGTGERILLIEDLSIPPKIFFVKKCCWD